MKVFKKKLVQRLSCVCCAVAFAIFSVFSVCGVLQSKKSEVISASAEVSAGDFPMYSYDIIIPSGVVFQTKGSDFLSANKSHLGFYISSVASSFCSDIATLNVRNLLEYFEYNSSYIFTLVKPLVLPIDFDYCTEELFLELSNLSYVNGLYSLSIDSQYSFESGDWYVRLSSPAPTSVLVAMIRKECLPLTIYIRRNGGYTQSDFNNVYNQGYTNGYEEGTQDGYDNGYNHGYDSGVQDTRDEAFLDGYNVGVKDGKEEAEEKNKRGLFASFESIEVSAYDSSDKWLYSIEADYGVNAVSFNTAFLEYEYMIEYENFNPAYYKIWFGTEHGYEYEIPLEMLEIMAYGDSSIFGQQNSFTGQGSNYYTQTWRSYPMYFDTSQESEGYPLVIEYSNSDPHLSRARLNNFGVIVPHHSMLRNLQFVATSGYYSQGYSQGVVDGYQNGLTDGEKVGYDKGYMYGENVGYNRGVGDSGEYTFLGLFTAVVDAPIKAFLGLLDFEILGMDMQKFFLSILTAALCIAVYRLFSGSAT